MPWVQETCGYRRVGYFKGERLPKFTDQRQKITVQFGPDGPFDSVALQDLRSAPPSLVAEKLGCGVEDLGYRELEGLYDE